MLRGDKVLLRARLKADAPVLETELYDDVVLRSRTNNAPWLPYSPDGDGSPFAVPRARRRRSGLPAVAAARRRG